MALEWLKKIKEANANASLQPIVAVVEDYFEGHLTSGIKPTIYPVGARFSGDLYQIAYTPGKRKKWLISYVIWNIKSMEVKTLNILSWKMISKRCIHKTAKQPLFILFCRYGYYYFQSWPVRDFSFDIRQRYREIAIRKVNGASAKDLYRLLFRKYITVLIIAFVIAIPLAYYLINTYTQDLQ